MNGYPRAPLAGRVVGYALMVVVVAWAARATWELLTPLLPALSTLVGLAAVWWLLLGRRR